MVRVKFGFAAWKPLMLVSVAFSSSTMNFSPLSGVTRFHGEPHAFRLGTAFRTPKMRLRSQSFFPW